MHFPLSMDESAPGPPESRVLSAAASDFIYIHRADILCGPCDLSSYVDLTVHGGVLTLTSPQLLMSRSRSFLIYMKAKVGDAPAAEASIVWSQSRLSLNITEFNFRSIVSNVCYCGLLL